MCGHRNESSELWPKGVEKVLIEKGEILKQVDLPFETEILFAATVERLERADGPVLERHQFFGELDTRFLFLELVVVTIRAL